MVNVYEDILIQQRHMLHYLKGIVWGSGNINGILQWRDRKRLYDLTENVEVNGYVLTKKDFQFLESLHQKYKF